MAFGSLDHGQFKADNRVYGKNKSFAIASAEYSPGACVRTCSRRVRRRVSGLQYPTTAATDNRRARRIAFHAKLWQRRGRQHFIVDGNSVGFDRRRHRFIRVVERFRIFRKRNHFPDERAGGSKRAVHGDFYPTRSWQFAGQHFFRKQCFGLFVETVVQRIRNADDQSAQRVADVESQHFNGSGI